MGVEITHVRDWRIPIVERVAFSNDQPSSFLIKCRSVCRRTIPLQRLDIRAEYQLIGWPYPLDSKKCKTRSSSPSGRPLASSIGKASFATSLVGEALRLEPHPPIMHKPPGRHPGNHSPQPAGHQELILENPWKSLSG